MKVNKIGERLSKSYEEWREYLNDSKEYKKLKKDMPKAIDKLINQVNSLDDKFLGKYGAFMDIKYIRKKAQEIYNRSKNIINK
tara:strand:+ start:160 stop:408 length:249 start_codon:yes stop_codon:yes gene_type:complete